MHSGISLEIPSFLFKNNFDHCDFFNALLKVIFTIDFKDQFQGFHFTALVSFYEKDGNDSKMLGT